MAVSAILIHLGFAGLRINGQRLPVQIFILEEFRVHVCYVINAAISHVEIYDAESKFDARLLKGAFPSLCTAYALAISAPDPLLGAYVMYLIFMPFCKIHHKNLWYLNLSHILYKYFLSYIHTLRCLEAQRMPPSGRCCTETDGSEVKKWSRKRT